MLAHLIQRYRVRRQRVYDREVSEAMRFFGVDPDMDFGKMAGAVEEAHIGRDLVETRHIRRLTAEETARLDALGLLTPLPTRKRARSR